MWLYWVTVRNFPHSRFVNHVDAWVAVASHKLACHALPKIRDDADCVLQGEE
jgi:hypothetical protein